MSAAAGIVVLSESLAETYVDRRTTLSGYVDRYTPGAMLSQSQAAHFDETVTLLAGEIYRIEFDTQASVSGFSTPVPEPASAALWLAGLAGLCAARQRRRTWFRRSCALRLSRRR